MRTYRNIGEVEGAWIPYMRVLLHGIGFPIYSFLDLGQGMYIRVRVF